MADNLRKYTTQEVLNKVYTDSSGVSIGINDRTSKETLNAVLDTSNNRLQVAVAGGTISGDVTIDGDLTVSGSASNTFDETITGQLIAGTTLGSVSVPSLALGDGDTGFYEGGDDLLSVSIAGSKKTEWDSSGNYIQFGHSSSFPTIDSGIIASATNPGYALRRSDMTDGIGGVQGTVNLITNSVSRLIVDDNSKISLSNNDDGTSNTVFGKNAGSQIAAGDNYNVFIGDGVADANMTNATNNVGVGWEALGALTTGDSNTILGSQAGDSLTTGSNNVAIGTLALSTADGAESNNVAIGESAMLSVTGDSSEKNIAIGRLALTGGSGALIGNIAIGHLALDATAATAQAGNIAIGMEALTLQDTATVVGIGDVSNPNIAIGYQAGKRITSGDSNVLIGHLAHGKAAGDGRGDDNVYIGARSGYTATDADSNVAIGRDSLYSTVAGAFNVAIGHSALYTANENDNDGTVAIGYEACKVQAGTGGAQFASATVGIGYQALTALTTGTGNTAIGYGTLKTLTADNYSTAVGYEALMTQGGRNGDMRNTAIGYHAGRVATQTQDMVAIGHQALAGGDPSGGNTAVGSQSMSTATVGAYNTAVGATALKVVTAASNVAVGFEAGLAITSGAANVIIGKSALKTASTVAAGVFIGAGSGEDIPLNQAISGTVAVGYESMKGSGSTNSSAINNTAIGSEALKAVTTGTLNVAVGQGALSTRTDGDKNTAVGAVALANNGGDENTAIGYGALNVATGGNNVALGASAGDVISTGTNNVIIGKSSDPSANSGTNQIVLGYNTTGIGDNYAVIGNADITRVYMASDGAGEIYANGTINTSDRRLKENIEDSDLGLDFVNKLRPVRYNYIKDKQDGKTKYGIIAQEVQEVLKESNNEDFAGIKDGDEYLGADYVQFVAPLIKAVQELSSKVEELEAKLSK